MFNAIHWLYAMHQIFNLKHDNASKEFWRFLERLGEVHRTGKKFTIKDNNLLNLLRAELRGKIYGYLMKL